MQFLWPSKPEMIYDPDAMIKVWSDLGKLQNIRVQLKKNGCRAIVSIEGGKVTIFDRHGTTLTVGLESNWDPLLKLFPDKTILDGELIGRKQGEKSNRLYLWDMPVCGGEDLTKVSYQERYDELHFFLESWQELTKPKVHDDPEWVWFESGKVAIGQAKSYLADQWLELLKAVNYAGSTGENEGLVFKEVTHNLHWSQVKTKDIPEQKKFLLKYHSMATGK